MRVCSNCKHEIEARHGREQTIVPRAGAFPARRQVAAHLVISGETKAHRHDSDKALIVENIVIDPHPGAQALSGRVAVGNAAAVHADARSLAGNQQLGRRADAQHGPDAVGEMRGAEAAGTDFGEQGRKALRRHRGVGWTGRLC